MNIRDVSISKDIGRLQRDLDDNELTTIYRHLSTLLDTYLYKEHTEEDTTLDFLHLQEVVKAIQSALYFRNMKKSVRKEQERLMDKVISNREEISKEDQEGFRRFIQGEVQSLEDNRNMLNRIGMKGRIELEEQISKEIRKEMRR